MHGAVVVVDVEVVVVVVVVVVDGVQLTVTHAQRLLSSQGCVGGLGASGSMQVSPFNTHAPFWHR